MTSPVGRPLADPAEAPLPEGVWSVDPSRSEIGFAVQDVWGLRTVRGSFGSYEGHLVVRASGAGGELTIEADSVETGNRRRDRHLRSPAFFDVERHPHIVFTATAVTPGEGALTVSGELAIGASRIPLEIPVEAEVTGAGTLRLAGRTTLSREAAGLGWNRLGMIHGDAGLHARLTLSAARRSSCPAAAGR